MTDHTIDLMLHENVRRCVLKFNKFKLNQQKETFFNELARDVRIFDKGFNQQNIQFPDNEGQVMALTLDWVWDRFLEKYSGQMICSLAFILSNVNTVLSLSKVSSS